jgi:hypothetical protein
MDGKMKKSKFFKSEKKSININELKNRMDDLFNQIDEIRKNGFDDNGFYKLNPESSMIDFINEIMKSFRLIKIDIDPSLMNKKSKKSKK